MRPFLFRIPFVDLSIPAYGFMMMIGFMVSIWYVSRKARREGIDPNVILDLGIVLVFSGVIGARIFYYTEFYPKYFFDKPWWTLFRIDQGGLVWYGGLILASLVGIVYLRLRRQPVWKVADMVSPMLALGLSFGRIGCFLNGCCWGKVCDAGYLFATRFPNAGYGGIFLGIQLPASEAPAASFLAHKELYGMTTHTLPVHPTQVYSWAAAVLLFILLHVYYRYHRREGTVFALFWLIYPVQRFLLELIRGDNPLRMGDRLTISQIVGLPVIIAAIAFAAYAFIKGKVREKGTMMTATGSRKKKEPSDR